MAAKNSTNQPRLQIAQILADLNTLNAADPEAALALVTAHTSLTRSKSKTGRQRGFKQTSSRSSTPLSSSQSLSGSQSLSREQSFTSARGTPSPQQNPTLEQDPDLERATTLINLYEIRGRMKAQETGGLARARANVEAVAERYQRMNNDGNLALQRKA